MGAVAENLRWLNEQIREAAVRAGQAPEQVVLVAVSKTMPAELIEEAHQAGQIDFGENRMQEAIKKIPGLRGSMRWHFIGHLQRNKARDAVELFDLIQSVDSLRLADEIDRQAERIGKVQDVLVQVNTTGEQQKSGCAVEDVEHLCLGIAGLKSVRLQGLMTIGPFVDERERIREAFRELKVIFDRLGGTEWGRERMRYLSMGMSGDFEIALEEGANMLRIGTAIFGSRPQRPL